jgi:hypothetical protein
MTRGVESTGRPGAPFAVVCPGGGFSYVGSVHEGFPHAAAISSKGLNAFVRRMGLRSHPVLGEVDTQSLVDLERVVDR